ncbi:Suppressor protein stp22 of temperature-sensitive alpha-factor receptor and arginine permease [Sporothrix eucalyptigena]|uniref:Suppressor protein stp22 of temperature-sensitive alpha-factor receptor and arginine permease n=1 Tax=Sporothrix eucalyptigena TaxID=1812306 RepID=A0ABP0CBE2_9PEZI
MAVQQHVLNWLYSVLTSEYQDVNRTYNDVSQALSYFPSLSPRTDVHTFPNGASALLLHLSGTIPAVFRGATYRYPISLWVPHNYPREAPLVYVTPTETMMVRPGQHVDPQGQVYHPYLAGWAEFWDKSTICDFLTILRDVFAKEPPVIARQTPPRVAPPQASTPTPPPVPPPPQELATPTFLPPNQQQQQQQQPPPPPPKGNGQSQQHSAAASANHTPSPPPVPPHPSSHNNSGYPPAHATPSPPPVPPHPSSAAGGGVRSSWYGTSPPPPQAVEAGPSARSAANGAPPVPGRPPYQQSPLGQPPMSPSQQHHHPPYGSYGQHQQQASTSSPPPQQAQPGGYGQPPQNSYYQYQKQQQQQPQQGYAQQQPSPTQWQHQHQQYNQQQQQQQYPPQQQQQFQQFQQQQVQPRPRQPPPPDIMDEPVLPSSDASGQTGGATGPQAGGPSSRAVGPPPPVPPNPEKDALLHQLAQTLAGLRQQSRSKNDASLAGLQAQRAAMLTAAGRLQQDMSDVAQLSALLTSNTDILHESLAAADNVIASSKQTPAPAVDDLLVGPTIVANQLYDLVAEERALADAVFMLGRAVERGRVSPAVFAKMTRSLAREWYLKKALVRKVGRGMGLASA